MKKLLIIFGLLGICTLLLTGCSNSTFPSEDNAVILSGDAKAIQTFLLAQENVIYTTRVSGNYKTSSDNRYAYIPLSLANRLIKGHIIYDLSSGHAEKSSPTIQFGDNKGEVWTSNPLNTVQIAGTSIPVHYGGNYSIGDQTFAECIIIISDQAWYDIPEPEKFLSISMSNNPHQLPLDQNNGFSITITKTHDKK